MKIRINDTTRAEVSKLSAAIKTILDKKDAELKERCRLRELVQATHKEQLAKHGIYDLTDDKEVLADLIRERRHQRASQRVDWMDRVERHEEQVYEQHLEEMLHAVSKSGVIGQIGEAIRNDIVERMKPAVGMDEAARLASISEPVKAFEELSQSRFKTRHDGSILGMTLGALMRLEEMCEFALSENQDHESLKKRFVGVQKRLKALGVA